MTYLTQKECDWGGSVVGAEGAKCNSLGQRPRCAANMILSAVGAEFWIHGRNSRNYFALSALRGYPGSGSWGVAPGYCILRLWRSKTRSLIQNDRQLSQVCCCLWERVGVRA